LATYATYMARCRTMRLSNSWYQNETTKASEGGDVGRSHRPTRKVCGVAPLSSLSAPDNSGTSATDQYGKRVRGTTASMRRSVCAMLFVTHVGGRNRQFRRWHDTVGRNGEKAQTPFRQAATQSVRVGSEGVMVVFLVCAANEGGRPQPVLPEEMRQICRQRQVARMSLWR